MRLMVIYQKKLLLSLSVIDIFHVPLWHIQMQRCLLQNKGD